MSKAGSINLCERSSLRFGDISVNHAYVERSLTASDLSGQLSNQPSIHQRPATFIFEDASVDHGQLYVEYLDHDLSE